MPLKQDLEALNGEMAEGLTVLLNQLIDGTIEDLDGPIREIAARMTLAARKQRDELVVECRDQLALIVLEKKLRVRDSFSGIFDIVLGLGMNALVNGAIAGLGGLRVV